VSEQLSSARTAVAEGRSFGHKALTFGCLHVTNTGLNMAYSLAMMLVLARTLPLQRYSEIVLLTAIGLYVQPLNQAVARTVFRLLRDKTMGSGQHPEVAAMLCTQAGILMLIAATVPALLFGAGHAYAENVLYLLFSLLINFWAFDLQSTAFSLELRMQFVQLSLANRALQFAALALLWKTGSFLTFAFAAAALLGLFVAAAALMFVWAGGLSLRGVGAIGGSVARRQIGTFWNALLATLADLVVLNSPYAVLSAVFGAGTMLVIFDTVMKLVRLVMAVSRTLAEIALPAHSQRVLEGNGQAANKLFTFTVLVCLAAAVVPAGFLIIDAPLVFKILLGPNNVVPANAGPVAAVLILAAALYQPATLLLSYTDATRLIQRFTLAAFPGCLLFAAVIAAARPDAIDTMWLYCAYVAVMSAVAVLFGQRLVSKR
jgi:O-antigen/teichoic acid export membrane protein